MLITLALNGRTGALNERTDALNRHTDFTFEKFEIQLESQDWKYNTPCNIKLIADELYPHVDISSHEYMLKHRGLVDEVVAPSALNFANNNNFTFQHSAPNNRPSGT